MKIQRGPTDVFLLVFWLVSGCIPAIFLSMFCVKPVSILEQKTPPNFHQDPAESPEHSSVY